MVAGDVVNTAARIQSAAPVNGVLVGETTYRATQHGDRVPRGPRRLTRRARRNRFPSGRWSIPRPGSASTLERGRRRSSGASVSSSFCARFSGACTKEQSAQLVTLVGVPGIGKSRLVGELFRHAEDESELSAGARGAAFPTARASRSGRSARS